MASRKSNNAHYRNADLKRPFDNIKEAMGLTGNADSNYYTNLGKVSRYEGSELDNRKKQGLWEALQLANQGKTPDEALARHSGVSATDFLKLFTGEKEQPFRVEQQKHKARLEGQKVEHGDLGLKLATMIANLGGGTEDPRPEGYEREAFPWEGGQGDPALQGDVLENVMQRFAAITGGEHKVTSDPLGRKGERITKGKVGVLTARENLLKAQKEGYENLNVKEVNQVLAATDKIIAQTKVLEGVGTERINQIRQKVLDDVNKNLESVRNLKDMNKLINERILTEGQRLKGEGFKADTAELIAGAKGGELYLNKRQLEVKLETLKEKRKKAKSDAEIAQLNQEYAKTLKLYEVETKKQNKLKATTQTETAGIQKDTATAKKDRAVNLASMSKKELAALDPKILAQAEELQVRIRKGEQQIELAKARTGDVNMARNVKILKKANWNNKNRLQQLLSPYIQQEAKADASNAAGKFAHDTSKIMLKDQLKQDAKTSDDKVNINPEHYSWTDWSNWFDSMDVNKQEYSEISSEMFKHKDKIQSGNFPEAAKNEIIADIIKSLQVEPLEAQKIFKYTLKSFGK